MKVERTGRTTWSLRSETPVVVDGRATKYITEIDFVPHDPLPDELIGYMELTQEMSVEEAKERYPNTPIPGDK